MIQHACRYSLARKVQIDTFLEIRNYYSSTLKLLRNVTFLQSTTYPDDDSFLNSRNSFYLSDTNKAQPNKSKYFKKNIKINCCVMHFKLSCKSKHSSGANETQMPNGAFMTRTYSTGYGESQLR